VKGSSLDLFGGKHVADSMQIGHFMGFQVKKGLKTGKFAKLMRKFS
jgi:hypothetical protein